MPLQTEIRFLQEQNLYELSLPNEAADMLGLQPAGGSSILIHHESKMKLEWLAIAIREKFDQAHNATVASKQRWSVKRKRAAYVIGGAVLLALAGPLIANITHLDKVYTWMTAFTIGILSCLQFLKYLAQELAAKEQAPDLAADLEALREQIDKDFSL